MKRFIWPSILSGLLFLSGFVPRGLAYAADERCPEDPPTSVPKRRALAGRFFSQGEAAVAAGNLVGATEAYLCSLRISPHAFTAFNLGRVAEKLGDVEVAVSAYETYLSLAPPDAPDRSDVEVTLTRLRSEQTRVRRHLQGETPGEAAAAQTKPLGAVPPAQTEPKPSAPVVLSPKPELPPPVSPPRYRGYFVGAAGLGVLATGAVFNVLARGQAQRTTDSWLDDRPDESSAARGRAQTFATVSYVSFGVGAAAVATGAALLYFDGRGTSPETRISWFATGRTAGVSLTGSF